MQKWRKAITLIIQKALWYPLGVFLIHQLAASGFRANLYDVYPWLDIPMHLAGGFAIAVFIGISLRILAEEKCIALDDALVRSVLILSLTTTAAVIWEFAEWSCDRVLATRSQVSLDDTMLDVLLGMVGGTTSILLFESRAIVARFRRKARVKEGVALGDAGC